VPILPDWAVQVLQVLAILVLAPLPASSGGQTLPALFSAQALPASSGDRAVT